MSKKKFDPSEFGEDATAAVAEYTKLIEKLGALIPGIKNTLSGILDNFRQGDPMTPEQEADLDEQIAASSQRLQNS